MTMIIVKTYLYNYYINRFLFPGDLKYFIMKNIVNYQVPTCKEFGLDVQVVGI